MITDYSQQSGDQTSTMPTKPQLNGNRTTKPLQFNDFKAHDEEGKIHEGPAANTPDFAATNKDMLQLRYSAVLKSTACETKSGTLQHTMR